MAKYTPERVAEIRSHLTELDRRGVPVAVYAAEIGVARWTLHSWKRRFAGAVEAEVSRSSRPSTVARADLLEVRGVVASPPIEICMDGVVVRVRPGTDQESVRAVLQAVRSC